MPGSWTSGFSVVPVASGYGVAPILIMNSTRGSPFASLAALSVINLDLNVLEALNRTSSSSEPGVGAVPIYMIPLHPGTAQSLWFAILSGFFSKKNLNVQAIGEPASDQMPTVAATKQLVRMALSRDTGHPESEGTGILSFEDFLTMWVKSGIVTSSVVILDFSGNVATRGEIEQYRRILGTLREKTGDVLRTHVVVSSEMTMQIDPEEVQEAFRVTKALFKHLGIIVDEIVDSPQAAIRNTPSGRPLVLTRNGGRWSFLEGDVVVLEISLVGSSIVLRGRDAEAVGRLVKGAGYRINRNGGNGSVSFEIQLPEVVDSDEMLEEVVLFGFQA